MKNIKIALFSSFFVFFLYFLKFDSNNLEDFKTKSRLNILPYVSYNLIYNSLSDMMEFIESNMNTFAFEKKFKFSVFNAQMDERLKYSINFINQTKIYVKKNISELSFLILKLKTLANDFPSFERFLEQAMFLKNEINSNNIITQSFVNTTKEFLRTLSSKIKYEIIKEYPTQEKELEKISKNLFSKLNLLQNPSSCSDTKKLVCVIEQTCGFACQLHFLLVCFIRGYYSNRTVIFKDLDPKTALIHGKAKITILSQIDSNINRFSHSYFPFSKCDVETFKNIELTRNPNLQSSKKTIVKLTSEDNFYVFAPRDTKSYPPEFLKNLNEINKFTNDPFSWIMGQFIRYLFKLEDKTDKLIRTEVQIQNIQKPYVGIQIRRGNKLSEGEAKPYELKEYMKYIEYYYDEYFLINPDKKGKLNKTVYISTDEMSIIAEAKNNYPEFKFLYNKIRIKDALSYKKKLTKKTFEGLLVDTTILSKADFVVCTHSSNVCRFVYELMQSQPNKLIDPHYRIKSLDNHYYITNFNTITKVAIMDHYPINRLKKSKEISLKVGDVINIFLEQHGKNIYTGYIHNGYIKGKNLRTKKTGLFPSYKVISYFPSSNLKNVALKDLSYYH